MRSRVLWARVPSDTFTEMNKRTLLATLALLVYGACVPVANYLISHVGTPPFPGGPHLIDVGFGFQAPSGVLVIGLALVARDAVHELVGAKAALVAIAAGVVLSLLVSPSLALASALAFGLGELADLAVFTPLRERNRPMAVVASGVVGGAVDTFVFLQVAFGSVEFWQGQLIGKTAMSVIAAGILWGVGALPHRKPAALV